MAKHSNRARCVSRSYTLGISQVETQIEFGKLAWVERGISFRELSPAEIYALRAQQIARATEYNSPYRMAANELPGLIWEPPMADKWKERTRWPLLRAAMEFMQQAEQVAL